MKKISIIVVRTLMGLLFVFGAVVYFLHMTPEPELTGNLKLFMEGINASGYLMTLIKLTELVCGIAFVTGRFVPLATVVIAPVILNIFLLGVFLMPAAMPIGLILVLANSFVAYGNWESYRPLLRAK